MATLMSGAIGNILDLQNGIATLISTSASVPGEVLAVDRQTVDSNYHWTTVRTPTASGPDSDIKNGIMCVALDVTAAGAKGRFLFQGVVKALGGDTTGKGGAVMVNTSKQLVAVTTLNKGIAWMLETNASGTNQYVMFDGINGISNA